MSFHFLSIIMPIISVIIPVFNAETTLRRCINSFLSQTFKEWEMILVDDGSSDCSGLICDEYAKYDSRIVAYHKNNGGVSSARQYGLDHSSGEYVIHADPDDWVESIMFEELYNKAQSEDADMVICDFYIDIDDQSYYSQQQPNSLNPSTVLYDIYSTEKGIHGSCCNKLVKKELINSCHARFPEGVDFCEDVCFNSQLLIHDICVSYLNMALYHYVQNTTSITNRFSIDRLNSQMRYVDFVSSLFSDSSMYVILAKELVKKQAFQSDSLSKDEFSALYPEIKRVHGGNIIKRAIYRMAFSGYYNLAVFINKLIR